MNETDDAIIAENISKSFNELTVLENESITVPYGSIVGLLGENGVGKSTLMNILSGHLIQDNGTVSIGEYTLPAHGEASQQELSSIRNQLQADIGVVPEKEEPTSYSTPREFFRLKQLTSETKQEDAEERIEYWSNLLQFAQYLDIQSSDLSRGNQQKVMLSSAFIADPDILLIDEPLVNLDPKIQEIVKQELQRLAAEENKSILLATHNIDTAKELCDSLHLMTTSNEPSKEITNVQETSRKELITQLGFNTGDSYE